MSSGAGFLRTLALLKRDYDAEAVSIYEIQTDPTRWRGYTFYSLVGLHEMNAGPGRTPPMFYFKNKADAPASRGSGGGGEGIAHELAKLQIAKSNRLSVCINEWIPGVPPRVFDFVFDTVDTEVGVEIGSEEYWLDLVGTLPVNSPLRKQFGDDIAIEIRDRHAVEFKKREDLRRAGLTTIEIKLSDSMHLTHEQAKDRKCLADCRRRIGGLFSRTVFGKFLHRRDFCDLAERRRQAEIKSTF